MTNIAIKMAHLQLIYLFQMVIFHSFLYVYQRVIGIFLCQKNT